MGRWEPDAQRRLREAALDLFEHEGYERTTVAQIAERAGVTSRTFFRHFADKREVLSGGSALLEQRVVDAAAEVELDPARPLRGAATAVLQAFDGLGATPATARRRALVIASTIELRERELIKMAALSDALAGELGRRGVAKTDAALAADAAVTAMRIALTRWTSKARGPSLSAEYGSALDALLRVVDGFATR